jgi:hypothetical protein
MGTIEKVLFQDDFESDDTDLVPTWDASAGTLNTNPAFAYSGSTSGQFHYVIAAGGNASQDDNKWASKIIAPPLSHFFIQGRVYFKTPEVGLDTHYVSRKILWWSDSTDPNNPQVNWANFLVTWTDGGDSPPYSKHHLMFGGNAVGGCAGGGITALWDLTTFPWDTWCGLQIEVQLNTPGKTDAILKIWKDGTLVYSSAEPINMRGTCADASFWAIGAQTNRFASEAIDEYRYWDDVKIYTLEPSSAARRRQRLRARRGELE